MVHLPNIGLAEFVVNSLQNRGVQHIFGIPGGGSSLDIIEAASRSNVDFILAQTETAAALMAAVSAEMTGTLGVVLTGIGPGAASAMNGIAYATSEKAPLVLITDCRHDASSLHQSFDQRALFRPLVKGGCRLTAENPNEFSELLDLAQTKPFGPVHIDLSAQDASQRVSLEVRDAEVPHISCLRDARKARELLKKNRKPVVIAGLDARSQEGETVLRQISDDLQCPVLCTYKAKGLLPDVSDFCVGLFTGAAVEENVISEADLIIFFGLDPIEIIPGDWRYDAPILELAFTPDHKQPIAPSVTLHATVEELFEAIADELNPSAWRVDEIAKHKREIAGVLALGGDGLTIETVVQTLRKTAPSNTRLSVDSGAHMFSAMACWQASGRNSVLKSNGLSTMGFALPAAIASTVSEPDVPVVAVIGDGGLMMCLGELATAKRVGGKIVCVVINDAALSLIQVKQQRSQKNVIGTGYPHSDFSIVAEGFGWKSFKVSHDNNLEATFAKAFEIDGPILIEVVADPSGYAAQLEALRG